MKKILLAAIVVILLLVVGAVVFVLPLFNTAPPALAPGMNDCGTDLTCFKNAISSNCLLARVVYSNQGIGLMLESRGVVAGSSPASCQVWVKPTEVNPSGLSQEQASQLNSIKPLVMASDMNCKLLPSNAAKLDDPNYLQAGGFLNDCEGSLKTILKTAMERLGGTPTPA